MRRMLAAVLLAAATIAVAAPPQVDMKTVGKLASPHLREVSGIAASRRYDDVVWGVNDSGNGARLHAFSHTGADLGSVRVTGVKNHDWEDLAAFVADGVPYLLIADTGDNAARRKTSALLIVEEPDRDAAGRFTGRVPLVTQLSFRYPDGPRDCEAVAVDMRGRRVLLVSKRDVPAGVYELPLTLDASPQQPLVAARIASIYSLPRPTTRDILQSPFLGPHRHQPTGLDIADDGSRVALLTYQNLYVFRRQENQQWQASLAAQPRVVAFPDLRQAESVAFVNGRLLTVAEGRSAPLLSIELADD